MLAVASTVAEPVACVSHHTKANCTNWLPKSEKACPTQMGKKRFLQSTAFDISRSTMLAPAGLDRFRGACHHWLDYRRKRNRSKKWSPSPQEIAPDGRNHCFLRPSNR